MIRPDVSAEGSKRIVSHPGRNKTVAIEHIVIGSYAVVLWILWKRWCVGRYVAKKIVIGCSALKEIVHMLAVVTRYVRARTVFVSTNW